MERLKCTGAVNLEVVNCPLRTTCERFLAKSKGFTQGFIKPRIEKEKEFKCLDYIKNDN